MKQTSATPNNDKTEERGKKGATPFHPVHALIRCLRGDEKRIPNTTKEQ